MQFKDPYKTKKNKTMDLSKTKLFNKQKKRNRFGDTQKTIKKKKQKTKQEG